MERILEIKGHIIRDDILKKIDTSVEQYHGKYKVLELIVGDRVDDESTAKISIDVPEGKDEWIYNELLNLGCTIPKMNEEATIKYSDKNKTVPDDFYSTTNHPTFIYSQGKWIRVQHQRMDACIIKRGEEFHCVKLRDIKKGDAIVCGHAGIRIEAPQTPESNDFAFMVNDVSSERRVQIGVQRLAEEMKEIKAKKGKIVVVAGPVVIHTGGIDSLCNMIRGGFVHCLLSGNALAVHDTERSLYGTSLGIDLETGTAIQGGHKNHMRAINTINRSGSIRQAVEDGTLTSGIMYECVKNDVSFVLAGSIRDDGPLPDTIMDLIVAQEKYAEAVADADLVIMLSTMLHAIGTGNMLPSWVKTVCVDINPAVVAKLVDRGSAQTQGLVTDVGLFLSMLDQKLQ
ncbi:TIGR00300 family protein [Ammoniphilus resinae]|uniref:ornithine cyclodeaminase n=1 Tax=Ammoniphilus resinae TaxID=861532 RepID=A0ABS4GWH4_9BACL|nr:TIGR00300 family protein [Ammoniphilus resinae]MBP1934623.1 lysine-ketoglutarate reductase/saccharopine dehydrogenase-like protein (TIGR00300 family) [Ammoniphilus resinae]